MTAYYKQLIILSYQLAKVDQPASEKIGYSSFNFVGLNNTNFDINNSTQCPIFNQIVFSYILKKLSVIMINPKHHTDSIFQHE